MEVMSPVQDIPSLKRGSRRGLGSSSYSSNTKPRNSTKQLQKLFTLYNAARDEFYQSQLPGRLQTMLAARNRPKVNKAISLGLGSLAEASKDQPRRIKQLVIFIAITASMQTSSDLLPLYAQDPTFTKRDEEFLGLLGVQVLRTPSASHLGEAGAIIDVETLVYCPFLTIAAYTLLLGQATSESEKGVAPLVIGDDFNALKIKWEKKTSEYKDIEVLMKAVRLSGYQRRVVSGDGFWKETDYPFPMALYWRQSAQPATVEVREQTRKRPANKLVKGKL